MLNHTTIDVALLATVNLLRGSKPNDRSAADRHYAVTITMLEQAYAYFNTYVTRDVTACRQRPGAQNAGPAEQIAMR
jgi:hypothetical protein